MMFTLAHRRSNPSGAVLLAAATFAAGVGVGTVMGPTLAPGLAGHQVIARNPTVPAPAFGPGKSDPRLAIGAHPADVLRVLDGDTFEARVRLWPGLEVTTKIRLRGIDAPELKARCPEERTKAERARDALKAMLAEGDVAVTHVGLDKYGGRVLADAATHSVPDIGAAMRVKGLARAYAGGHRESWCGGA